MRYAAVIVVIAAIADLTVWSGVYTDAQAKRGGALYAERCASCHAPDLSGLDQAPALAGADFMTEWNDLSLNDLVERVNIQVLPVPTITVKLDKHRAARLTRWARRKRVPKSAVIRALIDRAGPIETGDELLEWVEASDGKGLGLAQKKP